MSLTKRYDKVPETVEAVQLTAENIDEVAKWCGGRKFGHIKPGFPTEVTYILYLSGNAGPIAVNMGDYVLRHERKSRFEPRNASSFEHNYILKEESGRHEEVSEET